MIANPNPSAASGDEWIRENGLRSDATKFSKILQLFPEEAQKLIELESMSESEKRDALQKIAFERDIRLQAKLDSERYFSENRNYLDAYLGLSAKQFQVQPARSFFSKPAVFSIPSRLAQSTVRGSRNRSDLSYTRTPMQIGDAAFVIIDRSEYRTRRSLNRSLLPVGGNRKSRNTAQIEGIISFADHEVYFRTTLSTSLMIEEIKRNIIQNWFLREKHSNKSFDGSPENLDYICLKSSIDLDGFLCKDPRETLAKFAINSDLNFDDLEIKIMNKLSVASMGVKLNPIPERKISNFQIELPNERSRLENSTALTQTSFRGPSKVFPSEANLISDMGKNVIGMSAASTAPNTRDKYPDELPVPFGLRKDAPRVFTESLPKMNIDAQAKRYLCGSLPNLKNTSLSTQPPMETLVTMSTSELEHLESFKVWNRFGRIEFTEPVDLTDADLDSEVLLQHGLADVYPPDRFDEDRRPQVGSKLNRPAIVTLYDVQDGDKGVPFTECLEHLDVLGAQRENWDPRTGTLVVFLPHGF